MVGKNMSIFSMAWRIKGCKKIIMSQYGVVNYLHV